MIDLKIDGELCVRCGECVSVCPSIIIKMEDGLPFADPEREQNCIACQHCLMVCKTGALGVLGFEPGGSAPLKDAFPTADQMEMLIKGRRSCRAFRKEGLDRETLDKLLDISAAAPTGRNTMQTLFTVVDDPLVMASIRDDSYAALQKLVDAGELPEQFERFASFLAPWWNKGADTLYRGAPHMLVTSCPTNGPSTPADGYIAMSYFELMAHTMGIGTLWCGLGKWMLEILAPQIGARLHLPPEHTFVYMMMFGKPARKYHRTVQRGKARVNRVR